MNLTECSKAPATARPVWSLSDWHKAMERINDFIEQQRVQLARAEALREELYRMPIDDDAEESAHAISA